MRTRPSRSGFGSILYLLSNGFPYKWLSFWLRWFFLFKGSGAIVPFFFGSGLPSTEVSIIAIVDTDSSVTVGSTIEERIGIFSHTSYLWRIALSGSWTSYYRGKAKRPISPYGRSANTRPSVPIQAFLSYGAGNVLLCFFLLSCWSVFNAVIL